MNPFREAKPIWTQNDTRPNVYIECRETLPFDGTPVTLTISVDTQFAAYVGGRLAATGQFSDYPDAKVFEQYDLTPYFAAGENDLRIVAYCQNRAGFTYRPGKPYLIYTVTAGETLLCASGEATLCRPHPHFVSGDIERVTKQIGYSFHYDATAEAQPWQSAAVIPDCPETFSPRPIEPLTMGEDAPARVVLAGGYREQGSAPDTPTGIRMQTAWLCGKRTAQPLPADGAVFSSPEGADGICLIVDLFAESVGFLSLDLDLPCDAEILVGWGEHLDDCRVRTSVGPRNFAAQYIGHAGRNRFLNPFRRLGLRYMQLHIAAPTVTLRYAGIRSVDYPLAAPRFAMADPLHDRILSVALRTLRLCMHDHYEDCPWREQALYAMDSRNQMLCGYHAFGEYRFARASLALMAHSLREDGMLEICSPAKSSITIPCFTAVWIRALAEYLAYSGDIDFAREMLPAARAIAHGFADRLEANGLLPYFTDKRYWNFYEWQKGLSGKIGGSTAADALTYDAPLCAFVSMAFSSLAEICAKLEEADAADWQAAHQRLNADIHAAFYDAERGVYASYADCLTGEKLHYAELTQALCLCTGACPADEAGRVRANLASGEGLLPVSLSHSIYKYDALLVEPDRYGTYVRREIERLWGDMLMQGATTFWETEVGADDFDFAGSLCHGWSAVPVYLYGRYSDVLGLKLIADKA